MDRSEEIDNKVESQKRSREFRNGVITGGLVTALLFVGIYAGGTAYQMYKVREAQADAAQSDESVINADTLQKMKLIEDAIASYYYYEDDISYEELQDGIYKGMVNSLGDPYSEYYSREELEEVMSSNMGISYGIGAYISSNDQRSQGGVSGAGCGAERRRYHI